MNLPQSPSLAQLLRSPMSLMVSVPALSGCWITGNTAASAEYSRQVSTASLRVAQAEVELESARERLAQIEEVLRTQGQNQADRLQNFDQVNQEVSRLRGQIEVLQFDMTDVKSTLDSRAIDSERRLMHGERRLAQVEKVLNLRTPPLPTDAELGLVAAQVGPDSLPLDGGVGTALVTQLPEPSQPPAASPEDAIKLAKEHIAAQRPAVARVLLKQAIDTYPDSKELPELRYLHAETLFAEQTWSTAALAFKGVIDDHPKSDFAPWAMLRQGECFAGLGQDRNAKLFYEGVIQRYPKAEAARVAKEKLGR